MSAASEKGLLTFFTLVENQGGTIVQETPRLDLETYIQHYKGRTRLERLLFIASSSVPLCVDALKAAHAEAKRGKDVHRYCEVMEALRIVAPDDPNSQPDRVWVSNTERANKAETARLEAELKGYKNNLIKESIRMANEELGKHFEAIGDLNNALEAYARMRPDISTAKHIIDVGRHLISITVQRREWHMVTANLNKITGFPNSDDEKAVQPFIRIIHGLALLGQEKYHEAAISLLAAEPLASTGYHEFLSPNDVAIYGGLLALATMDRRDLQVEVLENSSFRSYLEMEPHLRRAITQFVNGRYSACLAILDSYRPEYLLDLYLQRHVATLFNQIRRKCITQYLIPFSCVTLESMEQAFAVPGQSLEEELAAMIRSGVLDARIDAIDKLIVTAPIHPRLKMQISGLETAKGYEKDAVDRIRRMNIAAAELEVKGQRKGSHGFEKFSSMSESWYEQVQAGS